jgi:hypothetical protein
MLFSIRTGWTVGKFPGGNLMFERFTERARRVIFAACGVRDAKRSPSRIVLSLKVRLCLQACRCEFSALLLDGQTNR